MDKCQVEGCKNEVSRAGFKLCKEHWQSEKNGEITACTECGVYKENTYPLCGKCFAKKNPEKSHEKSTGFLSSTAIGKEFDLKAERVNQILAELGWIKKDVNGWITTPQGKTLGGQRKESKETGVPYVVWPEKLIENKALILSIKSYKGEKIEEPILEHKKSEDLNFREKHKATHRASDGHMVRSRAELLIDNWLYVANKVHAYEKKLPVDEEVYCDFYLPEGVVYIEFWGMENDQNYCKRKEAKIEIYKKYGFNLIELKDEHINFLDDHLPKLLRKFGIITQ
jgi:hypothetical protein